MATDESYASPSQMDTSKSNYHTPASPTDDTLKAFLELAGIATSLLTGPVSAYAHFGLSLLRIARTMQKGYQIPPEFEKYFKSLEELTEVYNKRHGI